jgi:DHA2 family multidrug resistance protein-like MFS transporter
VTEQDQTEAGQVDHLSAALLTAGRDAFSSGLHTVAAITGVVAVGMAVLIVTQLRRIPPFDRTETQAETPADAGPAPATADADTTSTTRGGLMSA